MKVIALVTSIQGYESEDVALFGKSVQKLADRAFSVNSQSKCNVLVMYRTSTNTLTLNLSSNYILPQSLYH